MDDFVCNKLTEWDLSDWIERFKYQGIDKESFECLKDQDIDQLIAKVGPRAKFRKRLKALEVLPSTIYIGDKGKRKLDSQEECTNIQSPTKKWCGSTPGSNTESILSYVKNIMRNTYEKLHHGDETMFNAFLKSKISDLETNKREFVGVFGKTGAGKSSLINAIIGEKDLLPSGSISACTTVMIKVEANMLNLKYEAEIEFITKEEWKDELWYFFHILGDKADEERYEDCYDTVERLSAVYGEEWKNKSPENLMDNKYFRKIPEFLCYRRKILTCESAKELSAKLAKYTGSDSKEAEGRRWYWPLVKCVTVRVPCNSLLQHVTLVDLPGNGDRNKSRDTMWKGIVESCSTVWVVTEMNRAASDKESWKILESASSLMGNGGECQHIHFICTKSDLVADSDDDPAAARTLIFKTNMKAKEEVNKQFNNRNRTTKHFSDDCFRVFTVSSKEFLKPKRLNPDDTEIPKLQEFLQNLNDSYSKTLNYVSGAYEILSVIQWARITEVPSNKREVCTDLEEKIVLRLEKVRKSMEESYSAFEKCLNEGVEKSKTSCEANINNILHTKSGRGFHRTLTCVVENGGVYKPKKGKQINFNLTLSSCLTESIDEEFRKTFPNEGKCGPFNGVISMFSLNTEKLIEKYKHLELQLTFLQTEQETMKTNLNKIIRERKKEIYMSLIETIEETMQECYQKAAKFTGTEMLKNMRDTIEVYVREVKNVMFEKAKEVMLHHLMELMEEILKKLADTLNEAIKLSLKTEGYSVPDFSKEFELIKQYYHALKGYASDLGRRSVSPPPDF
ncbi:nuclear GTPase SLIP-GC-like isoform X1 [Channa argus]|uniref:nuclear GTPase SLIP-GC-like isoform X1 n=1 Tax=Channa argus TaxID=215402 RepID=UPI00351FDBEB